MKIRLIPLALTVLVTFVLVASIEGAELGIKVQQFVCKDSHYTVTFGVINTYTYNPQPIVAFKVVRKDAVLECKSVSLDAAPGEDGTTVRELKFDLPCTPEETASLQHRVFDRRSRNRVGLWLGDCPSTEASPVK
jgi:hypothetical protein